MKRIICVLFVLIIGTSFARAEGFGSSLGYKVIQTLYGTSENIVISPTSLAFALAMVAEGADAKTQQLIKENLSVGDYSNIEELIDDLENSGIRIANAAFCCPEIELNADYVNKLHNYYKAKVFSPSANAVDEINSWVNDQTDGLIDEMLNSIPNSDNILYLINALCMDAQWKIPFDKAKSTDGIFLGKDSEHEVTFMNNTGIYSYSEHDDAQIVKLDYVDSELSMYVILPTDENTMEIIKSLSENEAKWLDSDKFELTNLALSIPKLDLTCLNYLSDPLKTIGLDRIFDASKTDFSLITNDIDLKLSDVVQSTRIQIDEIGTRAAAGTSVSLSETSYMEQKLIIMNVNREFIIIIKDEVTDSIVFFSTIDSPN